MQYLKKLLFSLNEIFIMVIIQYIILTIFILTLGMDKTLIIGTIVLMILEILYILYKLKGNKFTFYNVTYFPYIILGISIAVIFNMLMFKAGIKFEVSDNIPVILSFVGSNFIGPIFEEVMFRYSLINKLEVFNSKKATIILAGIIFGVYHTNIVTIIYASIIGIINSYLYVKYRNILIPIIIHVSANTIVSFLFDYNIWILILGIILFVLSIFMLGNKKKVII